MEVFANLYEKTKEIEEKKKVELFKRDSKAMKLLEYWEYIECQDSGIKETSSPWERYSINITEWLVLAELPRSEEVMGKIKKLMIMNMIFPGGKIHYWMEKYMSGEKV